MKQIESASDGSQRILDDLEDACRILPDQGAQLALQSAAKFPNMHRHKHIQKTLDSTFSALNNDHKPSKIQ